MQNPLRRNAKPRPPDKSDPRSLLSLAELHTRYPMMHCAINTPLLRSTHGIFSVSGSMRLLALLFEACLHRVSFGLNDLKVMLFLIRLYPSVGMISRGSGPYGLPKLPTQLRIYSVNPVSWLNSAVICFLNKNHTKSARPLEVSNYL
jgi:hypothetical protein